jgi:shikimate kinase
MAERLVLVGMMGAGKTTVGARCAARLGWRYFDSDAQIVEETGRTVPELFAEEGEASFRAHESRVLREAMSAEQSSVVSAAGGVVLSEANRTLLRDSATVVWLRADVATLADRVGEGEGRPLLDADPADSLAALYEVRRPLYAAVADAVVDVDALAPEEVVDRVLAALGGAGGAPGAGR